MDLRDLHYFRILADELNLGRASERIPISQPGLSAAVKRLEEACGTLLFDRLPRGVRLTKAGEVLRMHADRVLAAHDNARRSMRAIVSGEQTALRFGSTPSAPAALFAPALAELMRQHPGLRVDITDVGIDGLRPALLRGDIDAGLVGPGNRDASQADLLELDIGDDPFVPMVRRNHPRLGELTTPEALMAEAFVGDMAAGSVAESFERLTRRLGLGAPRIMATAPNLCTACELVADSDLVALMPLTVLSATPDSPLVPLLDLTRLHVPQQLFLAMRRLDPIADAQMLQSALSRRLATLSERVRTSCGSLPALPPMPELDATSTAAEPRRLM